MSARIGSLFGQALLRQAARARIALLVFFAVAGILLVAYESYRVVYRELTDSALARRASISFLAATVLTEKFDRLIDLGISLATRVRFRELIERGKWEEAIKILRTVPQDFPVVDRITLNDVRGKLRADVPAVPAQLGFSAVHRDWYQALIRSGQPYISRVYRREAEPRVNVFVAAAPIRDSGGKMIAMLVLQVRADRFFEWTKSVETGAGGRIYVVDQSGTLAIHPKFQPAGELPDYSLLPVVQRVLQGRNGVDVVFDPADSEERVVAYQPISRHGWGVVLEQPTATVFALRNEQIKWLLIAYALALVFLGSFVYLALRIVLHRRQAELDRETKSELERRVRERTAQLEVANKELEGFSYSVSHDLRAPVRAIEGFARILEEEKQGDLDDDTRKYLQIIRNNSRKMAVLIESLLEFSRLGRRSISAVDVDMAETAKEVFDELRAGSAPVAFAAKPMPRTRCDRGLIRQVWVNLLSNAMKFTARKENAQIELGGTREEGENVYYVKDNGAGFDMRYADKLFGVFQRLHGEQEFPGTGVGLALVQRIIDRHGGRVWAEGKVGEGATFYFSLPAEHASSGAKRAASPD